MAKVRNPLMFAEHFGVNEGDLDSLGILNPTLNIDTRLFIDPLLFSKSKHDEIRTGAARRLRTYFENIIKLLKASRQQGDLAWRQADRLMSFHEVIATCLGYGAASIHGSAFGVTLRSKLLNTAKEIIALGIEDPELFLLLPLLEENVGPDRISDMITNIILPELASFTARIAKEIDVKSEEFNIGNTSYYLPRNPKVNKRTPVILLPREILCKLPVVSDWSEIGDAAYHNESLRVRVNKYIGTIWEAKTRREKARLRTNVLSSSEAVRALLDTVRLTSPEKYDFSNDPLGELSWRRILRKVSLDYPLKIEKDAKLDVVKVSSVALKIVEQYKFIIEDRGLAKLLWHNRVPHHERVAQMLFFAVADSYCKANNLDITPEADTGTGIVDFKFSGGYTSRILVEVKLSTNPKVVAGYTKQLATYSRSEHSMWAIYVVIDVGKMGKKDVELEKMKNSIRSDGKPVSDIVLIDGHIKRSASKR